MVSIILASVDYVLVLAFHHLIVSGVNWPGCPGLEQASQEASRAVCPGLKQASWEKGRAVGWGWGRGWLKNQKSSTDRAMWEIAWNSKNK